MEKLNGSISVESQLGRGSTFTMWFKTIRCDTKHKK